MQGRGDMGGVRLLIGWGGARLVMIVVSVGRSGLIPRCSLICLRTRTSNCLIIRLANLNNHHELKSNAKRIVFWSHISGFVECVCSFR